ncbi:uncharacterized methyltransferase At2g41040, chloroplastic [Salvia splendens]|uniref:uncharacterized methyltransferase At2g41040, chloroplastic n=1 Tax=Salvia splendens TaxID=180675 RepID=UPI001C268FBA|nr:uncharacterized methyltransferase At2g41040, chloroplastic [Salvia splendens]
MAVAAQPSLRLHHYYASFRMNQSPFRNPQLHPPRRSSRARIRASSAVALEPESTTEVRDTSYVDLFACPICYEPLVRKGPSGFNLQAIYRSAFKCRACNKSYSSKNMYLDLTVTSGTKEYNEFQPAGTELFRSPLVSFVYERGWRQNFNRSGFPGPDEEFTMAQEYFKPAKGGVLVDVSCGSGLFSRKFAKSGAYSRVVALDFSENMLRQCYDFIKNDETILSSDIALVRADVSRLPFSSGSVDTVHAGAALHCWPSPSNAVAEINRIMRSGGIFVGSTFLRVTSSTPTFLRPFRQRNTRNYNYLTEEEIEDLCISCGLINYTKKVEQSFIMFSAQKP